MQSDTVCVGKRCEEAQSTWPCLEREDLSMEAVPLQPIKGWIYKATRTSTDLFVKRSIYLYPNTGKFSTFHDEVKQSDKKSYYFWRRTQAAVGESTVFSSPPICMANLTNHDESAWRI